MFTIRDIQEGGLDSTGARIISVYAKVDNAYAIYRTHERVLVQYSDDVALGADQRKLLAPLGPVRGEINGLIDGWRKAGDMSGKSAFKRYIQHDKSAKAALFDRRVADALAIALQGGDAEAAAILAAVKADIVEERTSLARTEHVIVALILCVILTGLIALVTWLAGGEGPLVVHEAGSKVPLAAIDYNAAGFAAALGLTGAFFSIALGVRSRQMPTDLQSFDNMTDAVLRMLIGAISAVILYCLIGAQYFSFGFGEPSGHQLQAWQPGLAVIAFVAGFSERLVGNVLGRASLAGASAASSNPVTAGAPAAATAGSANNADERNPLGRSVGGSDQAAVPATAPAPAAVNDDEESSEGGHDHGDLANAELTDDVELPEAVGGVERTN